MYIIGAGQEELNMRVGYNWAHELFWDIFVLWQESIYWKKQKKISRISTFPVSIAIIGVGIDRNIG